MSKSSNVKQFTDALEKLDFSNMYEGDFFLTWEKTRDELDAVFTVADALRAADYGKVYIMLGMNELGWVYESVYADYYAQIIDIIRETHPDAVIYVQSILPVSQWKDGSNDVYTNANVVRLQKALC